MKQFLVLFTLLFFGLFQQGIAQPTDSIPEAVRPKLAVKLSPLPAIDYTPTLQLGVEIGTTIDQSLNIDLGYIADWYDGRNFEGFKVKGEYRFYRPLKRHANRLIFSGIQYQYKRVVVSNNSLVWRNNRTYQQLIPHRIVNEVNSITAVSGWAFNTHKPIGVETSIGVGYRRLEVSVKDVPDDVDLDFSTTNFFFRQNREGITNSPALFFSFRIVWRIR